MWKGGNSKGKGNQRKGRWIKGEKGKKECGKEEEKSKGVERTAGRIKRKKEIKKEGGK